jgi:hypothetical protein
VNPEQASKVQSWRPTRPNNGEGRRNVGKQPIQAPTFLHRGNGDGTSGRTSGQRGRPGPVGESRPRRRLGRRTGRASERAVVPTNPGNAGGGKGPHFWLLPKGARIGGLA